MNLSGKVELVSNIATAGAAVYILPQSRNLPAAPAAATVGTNVKGQLPGIEWGKNRQTLVLAISTHCHFCTESAPFFRTLAEKAGGEAKLVAVLPEPSADAQKYLNSEGVHVDEIKQMSLGSIVRGTPTMLLVDSGGIVRQVWTGKLDPQQQEQMLSFLLGGRPSASLWRPGMAAEANP